LGITRSLRSKSRLKQNQAILYRAGRKGPAGLCERPVAGGTEPAERATPPQRLAKLIDRPHANGQIVSAHSMSSQDKKLANQRDQR